MFWASLQGTNFLLRAIRNEAFEFNAGEYDFKQSPGAYPMYRIVDTSPDISQHILAHKFALSVSQYCRSRMVKERNYQELGQKMDPEE